MQKRINKAVPSVSIVIPAYNEENSIEWVLQDTVIDAPKRLSDFEVIVIDDGSTDNTGSIADFFAKKYRFVRVRHTKNKGYAYALLEGFSMAKKEFIAYMPADGQFLVRDMQHCLPLLAQTDLVLGARGSRADYTIIRLIYSYTYLVLLRILFNITFQDVNWLNIWRKSKLKTITIRSRGIFILAEVVIKFQKKGYHVAEASSFYRSRRAGEAKNGKLSIALMTLLDAIKLWVSYKTKFK